MTDNFNNWEKISTESIEIFEVDKDEVIIGDPVPYDYNPNFFNEI